MSGGSYDYIYCRLKEECDGRMYDAEMDDMIRDLAEVLHDLEWWQSADSSEDEYRATLTRFKAKWFKDNREERLKGYIDNQIGIVRNQLYALIGEPMAESKHSTIEKLEKKPKTGHWIGVDETKVKCSECEVIHLIAQYPIGKINWCPNCGCKMEVIGDDNRRSN